MENLEKSFEIAEKLVSYDKKFETVARGFDSIQECFDKVGGDMDTAFKNIESLTRRVNDLERANSLGKIVILGGAFLLGFRYLRKKSSTKVDENSENSEKND